MRIVAQLVAFLSLLACSTSKAAFVYTTSIDNFSQYGTSGSGLNSVSFNDFGNKVVYSETSVSKATAINGSGMIKLADQLLTTNGNAAFFDTISSVPASALTYTVTISNTATNSSPVLIKLKIGTVGTVFGSDPKMYTQPNFVTLDSNFSFSDQNQTVTLDGVTFATSLKTSALDHFSGTYTTPASGFFRLDLNVVGLAAVPEPSSLSMIATGVVGVIAASRLRGRRDRRAS